MKSREYFLFPDVRHAEDAVRDLRSDGAPEGDMHAIAKAGVDLGSLPVAEDRQRRDVSSRMES